MGAVIDFPVERRVGGKTDQPAGHAEVVIFPGVRIERHPFTLAERLTPKVKSRAVKSNRDFEGL